MIKANINHPLRRLFFLPFIRVIFKIYFKGFIIKNRIDLDSNKSVLLFCNHFSWWDGFFQILLSEKIYNKKVHILMLESELKKRKFLTYLGMFGIGQNPRDVKETADYIANLLKDSRNLVMICPQGAMESNHKIEPEWKLTFLDTPKRYNLNTNLICSFIFPEYLQFYKPSLYVYNYLIDNAILSKEEISFQLSKFYSEAKIDLNLIKI
jgi:1-acyl-sn-glycerol-3-phosphate acyltransferase